MDKIENLEKFAENAYRRFQPLAKSYYYTFTRPSLTAGAVPCMLFLGNHSAGKSSLINWVLGEPAVQDTGVAPTDDGFTVIVYGEKEEDVVGPAAFTRLPAEFKSLEKFGQAFMQRMKVKVRARELLKKVSLVDSPGMIDSAEGTVTRDYDFPGAVRRFAELSDTVFFLFDPDKPGTTGETVDVLSKSLRGVEFKLRVLLNKCDMFESVYDFARTYGATCWNLGRVLRTKDLPKIYTTYSGEERPGALDQADFNRHRDEFRSILENAASRRSDNVFSSVYSDLKGLSIRMAVVNVAVRRIFALKMRNFWIAAVLAPLLGLCVFLAIANLMGRPVFGADKSILAIVVSSVVAAPVAFAVGWLAYWWTGISTSQLRRKLAKSLDSVFEEEYRAELAVGGGDGLRQAWSAIRDETAEVVETAPLSLPHFAASRRRQVEDMAKRALGMSGRP